MTNSTHTAAPVPTGWAPASNPTMAEEYERHLLAIFPTGLDQVPDEANGGTRQITRATVWFIEDNEPKHHQDNAPIGWSVVQQQLARTTPEAPWIVGYLKQKGRAFVLEPPRPADVASVGQKLDAIAGLYALMESAPGATPAAADPFADEQI